MFYCIQLRTRIEQKSLTLERSADALGGEKTFLVRKVFSSPNPLVFQKTCSGSAVRFVSDCSYYTIVQTCDKKSQ